MRIVPVILALFAVLACATPAILKADPKDYPCGAHGVSCGDHTCCGEGDVCGGITPGCPPDSCCYTGDDVTGPMAARPVHVRPMKHY